MASSLPDETSSTSPSIYNLQLSITRKSQRVKYIVTILETSSIQCNKSDFVLVGWCAKVNSSRSLEFFAMQMLLIPPHRASGVYEMVQLESLN